MAAVEASRGGLPTPGLDLNEAPVPKRAEDKGAAVQSKKKAPAPSERAGPSGPQPAAARSSPDTQVDGSAFPALPAAQPRARPASRGPAEPDTPALQGPSAGQGKKGKKALPLGAFQRQVSEAAERAKPSAWAGPSPNLRGQWAAAGKLAHEERVMQDAWGK